MGLRITQLLKDGTTSDVVLGYDGTVVPFSAWSGSYTAVSSLTPVFDYLPGNIAKTEQHALWAYQQARLNGMSVEAAWKSFGNPNFSSSRFEALYQVEKDYRDFSGAVAGGLAMTPLLLPAIPAIVSGTGVIGNMTLNAARTYGPQLYTAGVNYLKAVWRPGLVTAGIDLASQIQMAIPQSQVNGDSITNYINISSPVAKFLIPFSPLLSNSLGQGLKLSLNGKYGGIGARDANLYIILRDIGLGVGGDYLGGYIGGKFSPLGKYTGNFIGDYMGSNVGNIIQIMWDNYYNYYYSYDY